MCVGGGGMSGKVVVIHGVVLALLEVLSKMGRTTHGRDGRRLQVWHCDPCWSLWRRLPFQTVKLTDPTKLILTGKNTSYVVPWSLFWNIRYPWSLFWNIRYPWSLFWNNRALWSLTTNIWYPWSLNEILTDLKILFGYSRIPPQDDYEYLHGHAKYATMRELSYVAWKMI